MKNDNNLKVFKMLYYLSSRFRMKADKIITEDSGSIYFFQLPLIGTNLTEDSPLRPIPEIIDWLNTVPSGKYRYIFECGDLWGISFEEEQDAILFKITWS